MADVKFSDFDDGGEMQVGDIPVGLRTSEPTKNFKFDFPGAGIKDSSGNYLFEYETAGALAVNHLKLVSALTANAAVLTADGDDVDIDIDITPKGVGVIVIDGIQWPASPGAIGEFLYMESAGVLGFTTSGVALSVEGTANQVLVNGTSGIPQSGAVILTTPQDIAPTSSPTFDKIKLSGLQILDTSNAVMLAMASVATSVNYLTAVPSAAGSAVELNATGLDSNINYELNAKGTGAFSLVSSALTQPLTIYNGTSNQHSTIFTFANTAATRTVTFQDSNGTVAYLSDITANGSVTAGLQNQLAWYAANGSTVSGLTTANSAMLYTTSAGAPLWSASLTNGQVIIGSTGASPTPGTISPGTGISVSNTAGGITISATGGGFGVATIPGTSQAAAVNTMYIALNAGQTTLNLPAVFSVGDTIILVGSGANVGGWIIDAPAGDTIMYNGTATSSGGTITCSALAGQSIEIVCDVANTSWVVVDTVNTILTTA